MPEDLMKQAEKIVSDRARCKTDKLFLAEVMGNDFVEAVHAELFDLYIKYDPAQPWQKQSEHKKRLILWPRGHFKSRSIQVEIVQIILNFPDIRILIMQGSVGITQVLLHEIKCHFTGENTNSRLRELFPEFCADKLGNADSFTVPARKNKGLAQATVTVASPRKIKTGQHYDIGFFDDLVNDANYRSARLLQKVREDFNMCLPLIDPPFYVFITGTRYAHGDLYEQIIRFNTKGEWLVTLKDCWTDDSKGLLNENKIVRFPQQLTRNGLKFVGFTREDLLLMQANDPEMFSSQYLNKPIQRGGVRLPKELLEKGLIAPVDAPPLSDAVIFVDLAATDAVESDDSVAIVGKTDIQMNQYVVDGRGGQWTPPALAQNVIELSLIHRPNKVLFEKTASCIYFVDYLRLVARQRNIFLPIDFIKIDNRDGAKDIRIGGLETFLKLGKLKFFVGLPIWAKIVEQCQKWAPGKSGNKHDDYPDTIGHMVHTFGGLSLLTPVRRANPNTILAMMNEVARQDTSHIMDPDPEDGQEGFIAF
jgi:hypothetical protein